MKFTKLRIKIILKAISEGLTQEKAAKLAGIRKETIIDWKKKYPNFLNQLEQKQIEFESGHLRNIKKASKKQWQASAWLLERKIPEEYSEKRQIKIEAPPILQINLPPDYHPKGLLKETPPIPAEIEHQNKNEEKKNL